MISGFACLSFYCSRELIVLLKSFALSGKQFASERAMIIFSFLKRL